MFIFFQSTIPSSLSFKIISSNLAILVLSDTNIPHVFTLLFLLMVLKPSIFPFGVFSILCLLFFFFFLRTNYIYPSTPIPFISLASF